MDKPEQVRRAVILLWISLGLSAAEVLVAELFETSDAVLWVLFLAIYALWAFVILAISRQRNWARIAALVIVVTSIALYAAWPDMHGNELWESISIAGSLILETVALFWLFTGGGAAWFRVRTQ